MSDLRWLAETIAACDAAIARVDRALARRRGRSATEHRSARIDDEPVRAPIEQSAPSGRIVSVR